jgi:hypothetical protein
VWFVSLINRFFLFERHLFIYQLKIQLEAPWEENFCLYI